MWNKTDLSLVIKTAQYVLPHTLYIRNRIVQWAFGPRIRNDGSRCTYVVLKIIQTMTYVGIDVSKATFVIAYSSVKTNKTRTLKNTVKGVHEFIQTISPATHHCVLEATGNYSALLVNLLSESGITVSLAPRLR